MLDALSFEISNNDCNSNSSPLYINLKLDLFSLTNLSSKIFTLLFSLLSFLLINILYLIFS